MSDLPLGWIETSIENVFATLSDGRTLHQGWSPQCEKEPSKADNDWGVLKTTAIQDGFYLPEQNKRLPNNLDPRPLIEVHEGDILITCAGPRARCGISCLVPKTRPRLMMSGKMYRFRVPEDQVDPRYVSFYLKTTAARLAIDRMKTGISDSGLNLTHDRFRRLRVPIAPHEEQMRIVAAIDEHFSRLDAGMAVLETVRQDLHRMRAASHRQMYDAALSVSQPRRLWEICEFIVDGDHNPPKRTCDGVPYLTAKHVKTGRISTDGSSFISQEDFALLRRRYDPRKGDVLVTCVGTLGEVAVVPEGLVFAADRNLAAMRPSAQVSPLFLEAVLRSPSLQKMLTAGSGSTAQPHLYLRDLRQLQVPIPALDMQELLVASLSEQLAYADRLEVDIKVALARGERLRVCILAAAFSGKLVRQDGSEEPASILLKRIAEEQASSKNRTSARSRKARIPVEKAIV